MNRLLTKLQLLYYTLPFTVIHADNCNYGGISIENGKFVIRQPCDSGDETFDEVMLKGNDVIFKFTKAMFNISLIVSVISIALAGVELAMAGGNTRRKEKALHRLKLTLIGSAGLGGISLIINLGFSLFRS